MDDVWIWNSIHPMNYAGAGVSVKWVGRRTCEKEVTDSLMNVNNQRTSDRILSVRLGR